MGKPIYDEYHRKIGELHNSDFDGLYALIGLLLVPFVPIILIGGVIGLIFLGGYKIYSYFLTSQEAPFHYEGRPNDGISTGNVTIRKRDWNDPQGNPIYVANLDDNGTLEFNNVSVQKSGLYSLTAYIGDTDQYGKIYTVHMTVNDGKDMELSYPADYTGQTLLAHKPVTINLNQGDNTIKFSNATGGDNYCDGGTCTGIELIIVDKAGYTPPSNLTN